MEAQSLCSTNTVLFASPHKVLASKNIINSRESKLLSTVHNWNLLIPPAGLKIIASLSQYKQQTELKASHFAFRVSLSKACQLSKWIVSIMHTLSESFPFPIRKEKNTERQHSKKYNAFTLVALLCKS